MKKPKSKIRGQDKYTVTEVGTLIEHFESQFKVFGESQQAVIKKLDATYEQVGKNTEDITILIAAVRKNSEDIASLTIAVRKNSEDIASLTIAVRKNSEDIKKNSEDIVSLKSVVQDMGLNIEKLVKSIDELIKTKVDHQEFQALEKRVEVIETRLASLIQ